MPHSWASCACDARTRSPKTKTLPLGGRRARDKQPAQLGRSELRPPSAERGARHFGAIGARSRDAPTRLSRMARPGVYLWRTSFSRSSPFAGVPPAAPHADPLQGGVRAVAQTAGSGSLSPANPGSAGVRPDPRSFSPQTVAPASRRVSLSLSPPTSSQPRRMTLNRETTPVPDGTTLVAGLQMAHGKPVDRYFMIFSDLKYEISDLTDKQPWAIILTDPRGTPLSHG